MLQIDGLHIDKFPFKNIKLISNLMSFDGEPFLQHFQDINEIDVIAYLVDNDSEKNRWLYVKVEADELFDYLLKNLSLRDLFISPKTNLKFLIDFSTSDSSIDIIYLILEELHDDYLPSNDSYFPFRIPEIYQRAIANYDVHQLFLEQSLYVKAEAKNKARDVGLIKAKDISEMLDAFSNSFDNLVEQEVKHSFIKRGITDNKRIKQTATKVVQLYSLNVTKVKVASFAVALGPNQFVNTPENFLNRSWLLSVMENFKNHVVNIDLKSEADVDAILKGYDNPNEAKSIYSPLIRLYNNEDIVLKITDANFQKGRILKPIKKVIADKFTTEISEKPLPIESERVARVKYNEITHRPSIAGITLFDQNTSTTWETEKIEAEGLVFNLSYPLSLKYDVSRGVTTLENKILDIFASGEELSEVIADFSKQFKEQFDLYFNKPTETLKPFELKRKQFLEVIINDFK